MKISHRDWRKENELLYKTLLGESPEQIAHWEHFSCPDAETFITGIDHYESPLECRIRWNEIYPFAPLPLPDTNDPLPRPRLDGETNSSDPETGQVRWGDGETGSFEHGEKFFKTPEQVFAFSPLEKLDFRDWGFVHAAHNYESDETIYEELRRRYPDDWTAPPEDRLSFGGIYDTMFMWPMLTFGWEMFLECCLDDRFERIMGEFAEMNRRYFRASSRLPINLFNSHDDIVMTNGPVCSPEWMHKYIFPCYEEQWGLLKEAGIPVTFMVDGCVDAYVDDVMACGAVGIISEPYTDYRAIARKYGDKVFIAGEGDNRVLSRNNPEEIRAMVEQMVETAKLTEKYVMCIGNHIPWNIPPEAVKLYFDLCGELAYR